VFTQSSHLVYHLRLAGPGVCERVPL